MVNNINKLENIRFQCVGNAHAHVEIFFTTF